jgi:hypothetical protein
MKKLAKNIPTYYDFPGTPIFRDTTALPFAAGGALNTPPKTNYYTYADSKNKYKKVNNQWYISNDGTDFNFIPIKDPTGNRTKELNKNAKIDTNHIARSNKGVEGTINAMMGDVQGQSDRASEWYTAKGEDQKDNLRHADAGRRTQQAIASATGSDLLGYYGSLGLGAAHEIGTMFSDPRPWGEVWQEAKEDMTNNATGARMGYKHTSNAVEKLSNLSNSFEMPDGYGAKNPFKNSWVDPYDQIQRDKDKEDNKYKFNNPTFNAVEFGDKFADGGPLHDRDINGNLLNSTYASPLGNMYREGGPFGEDQGTFDYASSVYASQPGNYFKDGGQFQGKYSLPEDSFKQGGNNLHNSVYASSPQQYPAVYNFGGTLGDNLSTRQPMYMPLDHITRTGGSILSMSNTPEMSGEGKDLVYANGGALNNSYAGGGQIYTYAGRPGAEYRKSANGWTIRTEHTNGFVPVKDPTGKRTALLNAQAKPSTAKASSAGQTPFVHPDAGATAGLFQKAVPAVPNSQYDKNAQVDYQAKLKPVVVDNTRDVTADQTLAAIQNAAYMESPEYKARQKAEKEAQAAFEKEQWDKYNKMSFGEKVVDRTNAALNQWPVMLSNTIAGEQAYIPGMASGLGDGGPDYDRWLKATGQTRGLSINDAVNVFNPGSWGGHAGRQYGEGNYATGAGELGLGLLGLKSAPLMGNQLAKSSANKLINLEGKLPLPESSFINEVIASKTPGRQETLREAENWTKDWVNHPATQEKILNSYKEGLKLSDNHSVFGKVADSPIAKHNLEEAIKFSSGYDPSGRLQEYPLVNQFVEYPQLNNPNIHKGNLGVSYTHNDIPGEFLSFEKNTFIPNGPFSPPPLPVSSFNPNYPNALATAPAHIRHGNWISRTLSPEDRLSTGVHELGHDWLKAKTLKLTDQEKVIKDAIDFDHINNLKKEYPNDTAVHEHLDYLADPTEVHARLMQIRKHFNLSPDDVITPEQASDMLDEVYFNRTPINSNFPEIIKNPKAAADLFNKVWGVVPAAGIAGGSALLANPWQQQPKGL